MVAATAAGSAPCATRTTRAKLRRGDRGSSPAGRDSCSVMRRLAEEDLVRLAAAVRAARSKRMASPGVSN